MAFAFKIVCYRSWKKMSECVPVFEKWIEKQPDQVAPYLGLAEMWLYLDQNQRARDVLERLLCFAPKECAGQMALAQAKLRLGEDALPQLRKAWMLDGAFARDMLEHQMDFRSTASTALEPMSLQEVAQYLHIPLKRILERARNGVLPAHPAESEDGLLRFNRQDLDRYYLILKKLGLEIGAYQAPKTQPAPQAVQQELFGEELAECQTEKSQG